MSFTLFFWKIVLKSNEILDPTCKSEVHNHNVFDHLMQYIFDSQNLDSTPPSPTDDNVPLYPTLLEQLAQDAVDAQEAIEALDRLLSEDILAQ